MKTQCPEKFKILGENIAYYRKRLGYTQGALAGQIGKDRDFIGKVERQETVRGVSLNTLFELAEALDVWPGQLLDER